MRPDKKVADKKGFSKGRARRDPRDKQELQASTFSTMYKNYENFQIFWPQTEVSMPSAMGILKLSQLRLTPIKKVYHNQIVGNPSKD